MCERLRAMSGAAWRLRSHGVGNRWLGQRGGRASLRQVAGSPRDDASV